MPKADNNELAEFEQAVIDAVLDLDFAVRCYYLTLSEDKQLSENKKDEMVKMAISKGWRSTL